VSDEYRIINSAQDELLGVARVMHAEMKRTRFNRMSEDAQIGTLAAWLGLAFRMAYGEGLSDAKQRPAVAESALRIWSGE
jgi:hypothetical protein